MNPNAIRPNQDPNRDADYYESTCGRTSVTIAPPQTRKPPEIRSGEWMGPARKLATELLQEVMQSHCDPESPEYNECEKAQCRWCELAQSICGPIGDMSGG